jgi:hypothetical protein
LLLRIRTSTADGFSLCKEGKANYCTIAKSAAYAGEWTRLDFSFTLTEDDLKSTESWHLCFDGIYRESAPEAFYIDNLYVGLRNPDDFVENSPIPEKTPVEKNEIPLVGTIRWDAFSKSTAGSNGVSSQVAKVLSPKKYHCQAPFFANVEADDTISFPDYTVEIWEQEAAYAVAGGINYYAYLWYESSEPLSEPRKAHLKSAKKNTIKMAAVFETLKSKQTMDEFYNAMKDACYLTVSGRPVVFLYGLDDWTASDVLKLRQGAANAGIKKSLYIVGMSLTTDLNKFTSNAKKGIDAISWYSVGANAKGESFESLAKRCEDTIRVINGLCLAYKIDLIPAFTTGRDTRARIETGVSWVSGDPNAKDDKDKPYKNWWAYQPTMDELSTHIENVLTFTASSEQCATNLVCSYGWNEHEEGGWLCPTLLCDEDGNLVLDKDGNKQANTERLDTLQSVLKKLGYYTEQVKRTPKPKATPTPEGNLGSSDDASFKLWWIIPVAVVIIGGAVATVIILKKKKQTTETNE